MNTNTIPDTVRMSHKTDPHTSKEAAEKASAGTKKEGLYGAILFILWEYGPRTPSEVLATYLEESEDNFRFEWPDADLYDVRRRMTELDKDLHRIEPIQVGTHRDGSPQYQTRAGQRVMRLVES